MYEKRQHLAHLAVQIVSKYDIHLHRELTACFAHNSVNGQISTANDDDDDDL